MQNDDSTLFRYTHQNQRAWDEIAGVRARTQPPADFFAKGGSTINPRVVEAVRAAFGDFNLRLIHLQCSTGEDTLSWAVLGAQATGVDISPEQINIAWEKLTRQDCRSPSLPPTYIPCPPPCLLEASGMASM